MSSMENKKLGDLLVESGRITKEQLAYVLKRQKDTRKRVGEILVDEKIISEEEIINVLQIQLGYDRAYINTNSIDEKAVKLVPQAVAKRYSLIPVKLKNNKLAVAMADPMNFFALDDVKLSSGYDVIPLIATKAEINRAIDKYYASQNAERAAEELNKQHQINTEHEEYRDSALALEEINNTPIVKLVDSMIKDAIKVRASDIHIEPFKDFIKIRYRVDGVLKEKQQIAIDSLGAFITRIKILSSLNIAEKRIPQDGRMIIKVDGKDVDMRVSTLPTIHGEKVVIRILNRSSELLDKKRLGMDDVSLEKLERMIKIPYGVILVTGPTGSGKSTTLYSMLKEINSGNVNVVTVEDPVEYMMEGINQVSVNVKAGLTFASGLRSILRQDPDIIMIGEIRDSETAEIAIRAAITGHVVLSTVHTNDAPSTIVRLEDMGIQPYLLGSSISGIIAQRLVRKICTSCSEEYEASEYEKNLLNVNKHDKLVLHRGKGCPKCNGTGYEGRTGIYEVMEINDEIRNLVSSGSSDEELRKAAVSNGMKTLKSNCVELVLKGMTTTEELIKIAFMQE